MLEALIAAVTVAVLGTAISLVVAALARGLDHWQKKRILRQLQRLQRERKDRRERS